MLKVFAFLFLISINLFAAEPPYCNPATFKNYEVNYSGHQPGRLHVYKIGKVTLSGMAIGESRATDVLDVAKRFSNVTTKDGYCTWYFNDGNIDAEKMFRWYDLPKPTGNKYPAMADKFIKMIGNQFDTASPNMVKCAVETGYVGLGCNGQKHRGPTVFAMFLAYAGCSTDNAVAIANQIWGENGIEPEMRKVIAERAATLATNNPAASSKLRAALLGP